MFCGWLCVALECSVQGQGVQFHAPLQLWAVGARTLIIVSNFSAMLCTFVLPEGGVLSESSDDSEGAWCGRGEGTVGVEEGERRGGGEGGGTKGRKGKREGERERGRKEIE